VIATLDRRAFLCELIGTSWKNRGMCWGLARHVQLHLFGRALPEIVVPPDANWRWMISAIDRHGEQARWREVLPDGMGAIRAGDGAIVLMARREQPAHIGVWLAPEGGVIHAPTTGRRIGERVEIVVNAMFETSTQLRVAGWTRLICYEPQAMAAGSVTKVVEAARPCASTAPQNRTQADTFEHVLRDPSSTMCAL
jgi:hypothetical protein